jgi:DNA-binding NarL/FixJ family response regulator
MSKETRYRQRLCVVCFTPFSAPHKQTTCSKSCGAKLRWIKQNRVKNAKAEIAEIGIAKFVDKRWQANTPQTALAADRLLRVLQITPTFGEDRIDRAARNGQIPKITDRVREVLVYAACGMQQKEVARRMGLSLDTIKGYWNTALAALNANNITHAVALARQTGILPTPDSLSDRDKETLALLATGHTDYQMAKTLGLAKETIKDVILRLEAAFGVRNRPSLIRVAIDTGYI